MQICTRMFLGSTAAFERNSTTITAGDADLNASAFYSGGLAIGSAISGSGGDRADTPRGRAASSPTGRSTYALALEDRV